MSAGRTPDSGEKSQEKPEPVLDALAHTEDTVIVVTRSLTANSK